MSLEVVNAAAGVFTALVISATAVAAIIQMRHMRSGNQIALISKFYETLQSDDIVKAWNFVLHQLPALLEDERVQAAVLEGRVLPPELNPAQRMGNFLENYGLFVRLGMLDTSTIIRLYGLHIRRAWDALSLFTAMQRSMPGRAGTWENFEYLAVLVDRWNAEHPSDVDYPAGMPRKPMPVFQLKVTHDAAPGSRD